MELLQKLHKSHLYHSLCLTQSLPVIQHKAGTQLLSNSLNRIKGQVGNQNLEQETCLLCSIFIGMLLKYKSDAGGNIISKLFLITIPAYSDSKDGDVCFQFGMVFCLSSTFKEFLGLFRVIFLLRSCFYGEWNEKSKYPLFIYLLYDCLYDR